MNILFLCIGNSGRSVMAERLFRRAAGGRHEARSAGVDAWAKEAEPVVVEALREIGIEAADHTPHQLEDADAAWADVVVGVCDVNCPVVPGKRYVSWGLPDPYRRPIEDVRPIRDEIVRRVDALVAELDG